MINKYDIEKILDSLNNIKFPKCVSRKNVSKKSINAFCLGEVNYRGQKFLDKKTKGPSRYNKEFPELYENLLDFMRKYKPNFEFTTIQLNKNVKCAPHIDKNNVGPSYIIALGNFKGGELVVEGKEINIKNKLYYFNGKKGHWVNPFIGTRYSIVFFKHTFKPPNQSTRNIIVKKTGLFKDNKKIKTYDFQHPTSSSRIFHPSSYSLK